MQCKRVFTRARVPIFFRNTPPFHFLALSDQPSTENIKGLIWLLFFPPQCKLRKKNIFHTIYIFPSVNWPLPREHDKIINFLLAVQRNLIFSSKRYFPKVFLWTSRMQLVTTLPKTFRRKSDIVSNKVRNFSTQNPYCFYQLIIFPKKNALNCSCGHSDCIFDKRAEIFLLKIPKNCSSISKNLLTWKTYKNFFRPNCSSGPIFCRFDRHADIFLLKSLIFPRSVQ